METDPTEGLKVLDEWDDPPPPPTAGKRKHPSMDVGNSKRKRAKEDDEQEQEQEQDDNIPSTQPFIPQPVNEPVPGPVVVPASVDNELHKVHDQKTTPQKPTKKERKKIQKFLHPPFSKRRG